MPIAPNAAASYTKQMMPRRARVTATTWGGEQHLPDNRPALPRLRCGLARRLQPSRGIRFARDVAVRDVVPSNAALHGVVTTETVARGSAVAGGVSMVDGTTGDNRARADLTRRDIVIVQDGSKRGALEARVRSDAR